jgi:hypothetical protein
MKFYYIVALMAFVLLNACTKVEVKEPDFIVTPSSTTAKENEEITFKFSGDPDQITFYSGEVLNDYNFKSGRILESTGLDVSFATHVAYGTHPNLLSVWTSTDFNGKSTIDDVLAATWTNEITSTFILAPHSMNTTDGAQAVKSGVKSLMPLAEEGKPIYIAFRYKKKPDTDPQGGGQRNWFVRDFKAEGQTELGKKTVADGKSFTLVYDKNFTSDDVAVKNSVINAASGVMTIRIPSSMGTLNAEVWSVSPNLNTGKTDLGPDRGVPIKGFVDIRASEYKYTFKKEGTYKVTFVASNANIYGDKEIIRQIDITITK